MPGWLWMGTSLRQQGAALLEPLYMVVLPPTELFGMFPPDTSSISCVFNSCMLFNSMLKIGQESRISTAVAGSLACKF